MSSLFASTRNTRALPVGSMRFLRSDAPTALTDDEVRWLRDRGITTVIDLRTQQERDDRPCRLEREPGFDYVHLPVTGGGDTPSSREHLHSVYLGMADEQMERILDTILKAESGVLYFCTAGKDRTGVVSALLLRRLGCDDETIIGDYMASKENLEEMLRAYADAHPQVDLEIIIPRRENMERLLARV